MAATRASPLPGEPCLSPPFWRGTLHGRPTLFGSTFLAAHDKASAPTCTGDSNNLGKETTCNDPFVLGLVTQDSNQLKKWIF